MQQDKDTQGAGAAQQGTNGIVTVNDDNNPTPEQRDELIGKENDTDRLRSERESVQQADRSKQ